MSVCVSVCVCVCVCVLPDDPPAVQQLVDDWDGFSGLQRDLVALLRLVGFTGDERFSCRDTNEETASWETTKIY